MLVSMYSGNSSRTASASRSVNVRSCWPSCSRSSWGPPVIASRLALAAAPADVLFLAMRMYSLNGPVNQAQPACGSRPECQEASPLWQHSCNARCVGSHPYIRKPFCAPAAKPEQSRGSAGALRYKCCCAILRNNNCNGATMPKQRWYIGPLDRRQCFKCKRPIKRGAIAYRMSVPSSLGGRSRAHYCRGCVPPIVREKSVVYTCPGCGLREGWRRSSRRPHNKGLYCGWQCERSSKAREARSALHCQGCGAALDAKRGDVRFCSNACRQKAYRARVGS